jgi:hypothetical protein
MVSASGSAFSSNSSTASSSSSANTSSAFGSGSSSSSHSSNNSLRGRVKKKEDDEEKKSFHLKEISDRNHPSLKKQSWPISKQSTSEGILTFRGAKQESLFSEIDKLKKKPRAGTRQRQQLAEYYQNRQGKTLNDRDSDKEAVSSDEDNSSPEHTPQATAVPILAQTDPPEDIDISSLQIEDTEESVAGGDTTDSDPRVRRKPPKGVKPKSLGSGIAGYGEQD